MKGTAAKAISDFGFRIEPGFAFGDAGASGNKGNI